MRRHKVIFSVFAGLMLTCIHAIAEVPVITAVERQPFEAATKRLIEALNYTGRPISNAEKQSLEKAMQEKDNSAALKAIQAVLDPHCVAAVNINAESRVKVSEGAAKKQLAQASWTTFLVKVHNEAGITAKLVAGSPNAAPVYQKGKGSRQAPMKKDSKLVRPEQVRNRFLDIKMNDREPLKPTLSGLAVEYRIIQLQSRDAGKREAKLTFNVGQGTQDIGFRNEIPILFDCAPGVEVKLGVKDEDGSPVMASFVIRNKYGAVFPNPARRLAPDFFFHSQIYRQDGETIQLPPGEYTAIARRGPEYHEEKKSFTIEAGKPKTIDFQLKRWSFPAKRQWFSGDHHVHAAGCAHYDSPTEGVGPDDMMRHILGEDLNVGCVLSWGPCWYTQKQFFEGAISKLSTPKYLMRYDVEVSGFPSSHAGHLCLLRLSEDDYPGTKVIEDWPSWTQPVLAWGKKQGGVVGYSHSGWGLALPDRMPNGSRQFTGNTWGGTPAGWKGTAADTLPDYAMPKFDGIGANEYIVTVANDVCDFISAVDTPAIWELNIWYHTLNCGMKARISGETDFPCIYGDKVGLGRIYVKLDKDEELTFDNWVAGLKNGRSYCGDGMSHIFDMKVNDVALGEPGSDGKISQLNLKEPGKVKVTFDVSAMLDEKQTEDGRSIQTRRLDSKPYWHIERSRIGQSRDVPVEIIVNGQPVAKKQIKADGATQSLAFDVELKQSSWVAVRIFPSVHTNPVFVEIDGQPIRASKRSAKWCREAVDVCWNSKKGQIRKADKESAIAAYEKAREIYDTILKQSADDE